jgi:hypothetical protein
MVLFYNIRDLGIPIIIKSAMFISRPFTKILFVARFHTRSKGTMIWGIGNIKASNTISVKVTSYIN